MAQDEDQSLLTVISQLCDLYEREAIENLMIVAGLYKDKLSEDEPDIMVKVCGPPDDKFIDRINFGAQCAISSIESFITGKEYKKCVDENLKNEGFVNSDPDKDNSYIKADN